MNTKLFYFSTTGNSLRLARAISEGLGGAELVSIPAALGAQADTHAERVGFVLPVYAWGLPRMVVDFVRGLRWEGRPYVFAVLTCGGTPAKTLLELRTLLRKGGVDLNAGFACREGANGVTDDPGFVRFAKRLNRKRYASGKERLPEIIEAVRSKQKHAPDTSSFAANCFGSMMHGMMALAGDQLKAYDKVYRVDDRCTGCRICERVCPRGNVKLESGKPVWHHGCEMCNACIQWCPLNAIHVAGETHRYHNVAIKAEDLMLR